MWATFGQALDRSAIIAGVEVTPPDTSAGVEQRLVDGWRRMTPREKIALVLGMSANVRQLALAGVRRRYPGASPREQQLRLAQVLFGQDLARRAYPEIDRLGSR
jgi:hypothetical protein